MCAICFAYVYKVKPQQIRNAILEFKPEHYRIETVARINERDFINDSKSTNIASTLACVESIKTPIQLLLGGSKKDLNYEKLFNLLSKRVKNIFAYGEIANTLNEANNGKFNLFVCPDLSSAFDRAVELSKPNDAIVLSPASASYDQFENYIERGELFNKKVSEYETQQTH